MTPSSKRRRHSRQEEGDTQDRKKETFTHSKQNEPCRRGGGRGRHARELEVEEGTQWRRTERKACKRGGERGRHAREADGEEGMQ